MSDAIKHECGIALLRLKKPLKFYQEKYGTALYGINKMYLLMEKQHNRGQDGAGIANIKFDTPPGKRYISRYRSNASAPLKEIFGRIQQKFEDVQKKNPALLKDVEWLQANVPFTGELFLGHLRYGTYGGNSIENCHPFLRQNNWKTRNLVVAGNFNLTNVEELFNQLVELGQHPKEMADTVTVMERIGHFLDVEVERQFRKYKEQNLANEDITPAIAKDLNLQKVLTDASKKWDGGYAMAGLLGHGDAFVCRDPWGIRPAFIFEDDEVVVVASERPVIQTAFNVSYDKVRELKPGHALIIKRNGDVTESQVRDNKNIKPCSFERIYFSRGSDTDIYTERKKLGELLVPQILKAIDNDIENTVFSFIPNTAEVAFYGMVEGLKNYCNQLAKEKILANGGTLTAQELDRILNIRPRTEKVAIKDAKLRTFITADSDRDEMVSHVYDITYGTVRKGIDNLVVIDDSIVRGTTLKQSILKMLDRLGPKKIIIVSSAPQIRYPDCYGIDMAKLGDFVAFQATSSLLKKNNKQSVVDEIFIKSKAQEILPKEEIKNLVKEFYSSYSYEEVSAEIADMLTPAGITAKVEIIYQTIENLHKACPNHHGDWYFSGDYPTPGGNKVVNKAFINFMEGKNVRAY